MPAFKFKLAKKEVKVKIFSYVFIIILEIIGISLSTLLGWSFYETETKAIEKDFENDVNDKAAAIEREVMLNIEVLRAIKGVYDVSEHVSADQFHKITQDILVRHKDIQALEWIPKILKNEREAFEAKRGVDFEITEREKQDFMIRAQERDIYFPVYYVEPLAGNEEAFGFDLASSPKRLKALEQSRDLGKLLASGSIKLVQESMNQQGFLIFLPVYHGNPATVEKRRQRLKGFVLGVFRIDDIVNRSIAYTVADGLNLKLIDITDPTAQKLLYSHIVSKEEQVKIQFQYAQPLALIGERQWTLTATPTFGYIAERRGTLPYLLFFFGVFFTSVGSAYSYFILRRSAIIEQIVLERTKELHEAKNELEKLTLTDGLTGIANRRHFNEYLETEWLRATRDKYPISLIMIDIDHFKLFNDRYGHLAGDNCLERVAKTLNNAFNRAGDLAARYGGEEFAIILPNTENSFSRAEKCRQRIENLQILHEDSSVGEHVTISLGISSFTPYLNSEPQELINMADKALYKAKENGRNKVCN